MPSRSTGQRCYALLVAAVLLALSGSAGIEPAVGGERFGIDLEAGPVWQSRNDVEIPNDGTAARFSLVDLAGYGPSFGARLHLTWKIAPRHGMRATLAPFSFTATGTFATPVRFVNRTFASGLPTEATYRFDSWRLGYRYVLRRGASWEATVGVTAKLRSAAIELMQGATAAADTDVGFVPLLHLGASWLLSERWELVADVEGLAGGPGRALDAKLALGWRASPAWTFSAGYRSLEGGADVPQVYNFAWFHYAAFGAAYRWGGG